MTTLNGIGAAPGIGVGPAFVIAPVDVAPKPTEKVAAEEVEEEVGRFRSATVEVAAAVQRLADRLRAGGQNDEAGIFEAHALIAEDPALAEQIERLIGRGSRSEAAVIDAMGEFAQKLRSADSELMRERARDVEDVQHQILRALAGVAAELDVPKGAVVVAGDLAPSETASFDPGEIAGIATEKGGSTGHVAILARSLGIPAVVGVDSLLAEVEEGLIVAVDGGAGTVTLTPSEAELNDLRRKKELEEEREAALEEVLDLPASTRDGIEIVLAANIGRPQDLEDAVAVKAQGAGLVRTEFLYCDRETEPPEDLQHEFLVDIAAKLAPHRVIIRTFDIGADKPARFFAQAEEANPFLGFRGIRLALANPGAFRRQLRAIVRAAAAGAVAVMYPFVASRGELVAANEQLDLAIEEVTGRDFQAGRIERGLMVEIPSIAVTLDTVLDQVDFVSIGTNDLVQYLFAADRTNSSTAPIGDAAHPSTLRVIDRVIQDAHRAGRWVGICGESASDPVCAALFVGLGVDELSVGCRSLLGVKQTIRSINRNDIRDVALWAIAEATDQTEVRAEVTALLQKAHG